MGVTTASIDGIVSTASMLLHDMPQFFEVDTGPVNTSTIRLPHPNVDGTTVQVYTAPDAGDNTVNSEVITMTPVSSASYTIDERNGLLKFKDTSILGKRCFVSGYHYEWFLPNDISFYAQQLVTEHMHGRFTTIEEMEDTELDIIAMGTIVRALWSLVTQFSTEINVSTPEGMNIPANQRFQQVWQMCQQWEGEYNRRASALNVGLSAIRVYDMRRTSLQTGRLVPIYKSREYDDPRPPQRIFPPILTPVTTKEPHEVLDVHDASVEEIGAESFDLGFEGWRSIGTSGDDFQ